MAKLALTTMARMSDTNSAITKKQASARFDAPSAGGADVDRRSLIHRARVVASVGLLGASIGGAVTGFVPAIGLAAMGAEEIGLAVGLLAGLVLVVRHLL